MEDFYIPYDGIITANQIKWFLSSNLYEINKINIQTERSELLKSSNCEEVDEYFKKINDIFLDKRYSLKITQTNENNEKVINLIRIFQKIISLELLNLNIFDRYFYLPCFYDNRGRQYYSTLLSPTFYTLFRHLYEFGNPSNFINLTESKFFEKIIKHKKILENYSKDNFECYIMIVIFIEIGKHFNNSKTEFVETEFFINLGIENYNKNNKPRKFKDILYIEKLYNFLNIFLKEKKINNEMIIFKDATSSGLQNFGILLGYKKEMLKYLNLNGDDWCDTYLYLINKFLEDSKYKKRNFWKKTIMTIPYNSTWFSCFKTFLHEIEKDGFIYKNFNQDEKKKIIGVHKKFYNTLKEEIKNEFYENKKNQLRLFKYNNWRVVSVEEYKINYKKSRDKYTNLLYMLEEDEKSTKNAMEANNMHFLDAELVRNVLKKFEILSIHDCFGIRLSELHSVMDFINSYYSERIGMETYSIHVII